MWVGADCPTLTDVAAQPRRPPEDDQIEDNLRQCEQYMLTQAKQRRLRSPVFDLNHWVIHFP